MSGLRGPGRMLVFVRPELDQGPILEVDGELWAEVHNAGWDIAEHNVPMPKAMGLQVFEGWVEVRAEDDASIVGEWRQLTHWEMSRVRYGLTPFPEDS